MDNRVNRLQFHAEELGQDVTEVLDNVPLDAARAYPELACFERAPRQTEATIFYVAEPNGPESVRYT